MESSFQKDSHWLTVLCVSGALVLITWTWWSALVTLVACWTRQTDYAHGFLVPPLAVLFLYLRRETFPGVGQGVSWMGIGLVLLGCLLRLAGAWFYLSSLEGWSLVCWIAGATWMLGGWRLFWWSLPAIIFLLFMVPLPWRLEMAMSLPLQGVATRLSAGVLQLMGVAAVVEGHTIFLSGQTLEVAQACAGLRIFMTALAMGYAFAMLCWRHWIDSALVMLAAVPIALIVNAIRIAATGMLLHYGDGRFSSEVVHDLPGMLMIPLTLLLFGGLVWYLGELFPAVQSPVTAR